MKILPEGDVPYGETAVCQTSKGRAGGKNVFSSSLLRIKSGRGTHCRIKRFIARFLYTLYATINMPVPIEDRLAEKGWSRDEIMKAANILHGKDDPGKIYFQKQMNPVVYWLTLIISIVANMVVSVVLIPFLLTVKDALTLYFIIGLLALTFGFFFNLLLTDIENVDPKHHVIAGVFIPALAVINIFIVINVTSVLDKVLLGGQLTQNAFVIAIVYVVAFIAPYLVNKIIDRMQTRKTAQTL
ncbi:hypothetical protein J4482_04900 [Candidatus Woesearchaeota archaeon]|nr:hypothetical protein [Candidatus Woesearchaeota archaeon]